MESLQRFSIRLAQATTADITVLNVIQVPPQLPPSEGRKYVSGARRLLGVAVAMAEKVAIPVYSLVKLTHNIPKAIIETSSQRKIDLMVLGWEGEQKASDRVFGTVLDEIILNTVCDIALLCRAPAEHSEFDRILIPVSNIRYAQLSLKIAEALTQEKKTPIILFHATQQADLATIEKKYADDLQKLSGEIDPGRYTILIKQIHGAGVVEAVLSEVKDGDLLIMGAPEEGLIRRALFGDMPVQIARATDVPIILTKKYTGRVKSWFQKFFGSRRTMLD